MNQYDLVVMGIVARNLSQLLRTTTFFHLATDYGYIHISSKAAVRRYLLSSQDHQENDWDY